LWFAHRCLRLPAMDEKFIPLVCIFGFTLICVNPN